MSIKSIIRKSYALSILFLCDSAFMMAGIPSTSEAIKKIPNTHAYAGIVNDADVAQSLYPRNTYKVAVEGCVTNPSYLDEDWGQNLGGFLSLIGKHNYMGIGKYSTTDFGGIEISLDAGLHPEKYPLATIKGEEAAALAKDLLIDLYAITHLNIPHEVYAHKYTATVNVYETKSVDKRTYKQSHPVNIYYFLADNTWREYIALSPLKLMSIAKSFKRVTDEIANTYSYKDLVKLFGIENAYKRLDAIKNAGPILKNTQGGKDIYTSRMYGDVTYSASPVNASYPNGESAITSYVKSRIKYPNSLLQDGFKASEVYTLTIGTDGKVLRVSKPYGINDELYSNTKKLLMSLPQRFTPATKKGVKIESEYSVTIDYALEPILKLDKSSINFDAQGGENTIMVKTTKDWVVTPPSNSAFNVKNDKYRVYVSCKARAKKDYDEISEPLVISIPGTNFKYTISITQEGAERPYISWTPSTITFTSNSSTEKVEIESNRKWTYSMPNNKYFSLSRTGNVLNISTRKNSSKNVRTETITLSTADGEFSETMKLTQQGRGTGKSGDTGGSGLFQDYYNEHGTYSLELVNIALGIGGSVPGFDELYLPINLELGSFRFYMIELSLLNFRIDCALDGIDGGAWEPLIKGIIPVSSNWAIVPYVGPACSFGDNRDESIPQSSKWSASGGVAARYNWGSLAYSEFSIGYHGGEYAGLSVGVSMGWQLNW